MRQFFGSTLLIAMMAGLAGCAAQKETRAMPHWPTLSGEAPLIIAHRGASGYRPEHTLEAYALAIDMGADVIEPDLVFSKDGVLVARHDRYLSTTTDVSAHPEFAARKRANDDASDIENKDRTDWWVEDFTLAELKTLRARQPFPGRSREFDDRFEVPTFEEMLSLVSRKAKEAGRPVGVYPETKHPGFYASIGHDFEAPLLKALEGFNAGPVFIQSFEPEILRRLKGKTNAKLVQLVYEETPGAGPNIPLEEIAKYADGVGPSKILILDATGIRTAFTKTAHTLGLIVHPWTLRADQPNPTLSLLNERRAEQYSEIVSGLKNAIPEAKGVAIAGFSVDWQALGVQKEFGEELDYFYMDGADGVFTDFPDLASKVRNYRIPTR